MYKCKNDLCMQSKPFYTSLKNIKVNVLIVFKYDTLKIYILVTSSALTRGFSDTRCSVPILWIGAPALSINSHFQSITERPRLWLQQTDGMPVTSQYCHVSPTIYWQPFVHLWTESGMRVKRLAHEQNIYMHENTSNSLTLDLFTVFIDYYMLQRSHWRDMRSPESVSL